MKLTIHLTHVFTQNGTHQAFLEPSIERDVISSGSLHLIIEMNKTKEEL